MKTLTIEARFYSLGGQFLGGSIMTVTECPEGEPLRTLFDENGDPPQMLLNDLKSMAKIPAKQKTLCAFSTMINDRPYLA